MTARPLIRKQHEVNSVSTVLPVHYSLCVRYTNKALLPGEWIGERMIIEEMIKGTYGEVSVSVQIHGVPTSDMVTSEGATELVKMAISRFDDQLQDGLYQPNTSMAAKTQYSESNGFDYNDMVVKVECSATLYGTTGLSRTRSYIGHLSEPITQLLVAYIDEFEGSFEAALEALMPKLELV